MPTVKELGDCTRTFRELATLLHKYGLSELRFSSGNLRIRLSREFLEHEPAVVLAAQRPEPQEASEDVRVGEPVEAPFSGVFYRSSRPDEPPFVEEGDFVEEGQVLGLLEANKVFSELSSPVSGTVTSILREDGALVQSGEPLFYVERTPSGV